MLKIVDAEHHTPPSCPEATMPMPSFTWAELEEAMMSIAATAGQRDMTPALVSATRKQAPFLPPSEVLREILSLAWVIADESFGEIPEA
jgi:hypothetical protein